MGVKAGDAGESCGCAGEVRCEDKGVILEDVGNINIRLGGSTVVLNRALLWVWAEHNGTKAEFSHREAVVGFLMNGRRKMKEPTKWKDVRGEKCQGDISFKLERILFHGNRIQSTVGAEVLCRHPRKRPYGHQCVSRLASNSHESENWRDEGKGGWRKCREQKPQLSAGQRIQKLKLEPLARVVGLNNYPLPLDLRVLFPGPCTSISLNGKRDSGRKKKRDSAGVSLLAILIWIEHPGLSSRARCREGRER